MSKWQWILRQFSRRLWVRATSFCILAIFTALIAYLVKGYLPDDMSRKIGANAVDDILEIIASSMLAVTTFSLSTMVAAYSAATNNVTPRATQLLLQDSTSQNALSVFIGAFLYSLVGIIALNMQIYGQSGRIVLFVVTILVIAIIVAVLLKWISYLSQLGRVSETIQMVEKATMQAFEYALETPSFGAVPYQDYQPQPQHYPVCNGKIGYVQHIDIAALSRLADECHMELYITMLPGAFNDGLAPLCYCTMQPDEGLVEKICDAFSIGERRSFDQDPRFGMIVLGEVASRALSPALNDAGTAIDIIGTSVRILSQWIEGKNQQVKPDYTNIYVPVLKADDVFDDVYGCIARDGAGIKEVGIRLQKALASLAQKGDDEVKAAARQLSHDALAYAKSSLVLDKDKELLAELADKV